MSYGGNGSFFGRLRQACRDDWDTYIGHAFVRGLGDGSLPAAAFRHYLVQDYVFLIQFARAWALAAFKADTLEEMKAAAATLSGLIDHEMTLHVRYAGQFGITLSAMESAPEHPANLAYTRYVIDRGLAGDALDLQVALAPCVVGYGEIGWELARHHATRLDGNPYRDWLEMYGGADYQGIALQAVTSLDHLAERRGGEARFQALAEIFRTATRLESGFWQMGLDGAVADQMASGT